MPINSVKTHIYVTDRAVFGLNILAYLVILSTQRRSVPLSLYTVSV